jgi:HAE1 family hydrophobic/amphiphilic exporter-1
VFIPVAFMGGMVGRFFYEFGITVAAAVLVSLFVSFTLDPMLSSRWIDPDVEQDRHTTLLGRSLRRFNRWFDDLHRSYESLLDWSLRHRGWVVAIATLAFVGSFPILGLLGGDFMPDFNRGEYQVIFKANPGTTLRETGQRARAMVRRLQALPEVAYTYTTVGEAGSQYRPVNEGSIYVKLRSGGGQTFSAVLGAARRVLRPVPGVSFALVEAGQFGQKPIQVSVRGIEVGELDRISRELMAGLARIRGLTDLETSLEKSKPELRVRVDRSAMTCGCGCGPTSGAMPRTCWSWRCPALATTSAATSCWCRCVRSPARRLGAAPRRSGARIWCARCGSRPIPTRAAWAKSPPTSSAWPRGSSCRPATTSSTAATPRSSRTCSPTCSRRWRWRSSSSI